MAIILEQFGLKIRNLRLKKKLSQEKLAELADLHRTYVGQVESGKRNIALCNIAKLAKALGVQVKDLF
ncbi:MAG TPA: helix-turn-helix transcriptional regulator [Atribacter sp.]|uniref:helix-turn-helix domain-containing protein n=1 Tax=Atribacter sp. TaxID=2847780 RepID=UPI002C6FC705|nr:helix-turn-helix transcriptional regulator [Atribacter sp.]HQK84164.1 helix-turn-helix transcriptional regulator [Atribacter sp.]